MKTRRITWEFKWLHLIPTRWEEWTIEEDEYTNRGKRKPPNPNCYPRATFFLTPRWNEESRESPTLEVLNPIITTRKIVNSDPKIGQW